MRQIDNMTTEEIAPAQAQHSPLPWRTYWTERQYEIRSQQGSQPVAIVSKPLRFGSGTLDLDIREANAAYIVRACNNAQRLADALKAIVEKPYTIEGQAARIEAGREALAEWSKQK